MQVRAGALFLVITTGKYQEGYETSEAGAKLSEKNFKKSIDHYPDKQVVRTVQRVKF